MRLLRGDFAAETVYDADPVAVARGFEAEGARWIHVVDLDAARTGEPTNLATVAAIASAVGCPVQTGGGVRSVDAAAALLDAGVARVVVGTAAVEHPELVDELCASHPGRVAVGLDARGQEVAVRGWVEGSGTDLVTLGRRFAESGVAALIVPEVEDLLEFVYERRAMTPTTAAGCQIAGAADAVLQAQLQAAIESHPLTSQGPDSAS